MLAELGLPLLRIRQRMKTEDYRGAAGPADELLPKYLGRPSDTAFVVTLAATWGRIASGRQEEALVPYLYCLEWIKRRQGRQYPLAGAAATGCRSEDGDMPRYSASVDAVGNCGGRAP